jgi:hypothetical protein
MRYLILVAAVLALAASFVQVVWAEDGFGSESWSPQPETTHETDVIVLKNGVRFEGLILEENDKKVTLARYSGNTVAPHTVGLYKSDIASIARIEPERRASLETEVRERLYAAKMAWRLADTRVEQIVETVEARRQAIAAVPRQNGPQQTAINPAPYQTTLRGANGIVQNLTAYRTSRPPRVTRLVIARRAPQVRRISGG